MFSRTITPLETIVQNERLKELITHPVLSTFITLKSKKFAGIFQTNFFIFMFLYIVPFFMLVTLLPFRKFYFDFFEEYGQLTISTKGKKIYKVLGLTFSQFAKFPFRCCVFATTYLTLREVFQLLFVSTRIKDYVKQRSNQFEIAIIASSWTLLWAYNNIHSQQMLRQYTAIPSAFIVIFGEELKII